MNKLLAPIIALFLLIILGNTAQAEDAQWHGRFWNSRHFKGDVVHEEYYNNVDFDWGEGSPASGVDDDDFSAKFKRHVHFEPGTYRFTATMDDGMRVFLDDKVIIDSWTDSQQHTMSVDVPVSGGGHDLKVEYYEAGNMAVAKFHWDLIHPEGQPSGSGGGHFYPNWKAEYFNNTSLSGAPALVRDDRYLDHNWGLGSPQPGVIGNDFFSARWTKTVQSTPGLYHIHMTSDDGSRLYINNQLMIDNWGVQAATTRAVDYNYPGGPVEIRVEYFENTENANIEVHLGLIPDGGVVASQPVPVPSAASSAAGCTPSQGFTAYVNSATLNFREGPSPSFPIMATLPECTTVQLTGFKNPDGTWVQVVLPDGRKAWANSSYLIMGVSTDQMTVLSD